MRWTLSVSPVHGNARAAEMVSPPGSTDRVIESAGTPGSATCTRRWSSVSVISTGGSHATVVCWKNWRCRRSARSSLDSGSPHTQLDNSRDLTGPMWRRSSPQSRAARNAPKSALRGLGLAQQPLAKGDNRRALGNDLRADKVIGRARLELDLEGRAQAPGLEIGVNQRPQRERHAEPLRCRLERQDIGREMRPARAVDLVGAARALQPLLPGVAVCHEIHRIVMKQRVPREIRGL